MKLELKNCLIVFVVALLSMISFRACKDKQTTTVALSTEKELWTCSMHPEIIRDKPGVCPICGMDLIKKEEKARGIYDVRLNDLLQPTDRFVVSSIPVTTMNRSAELIEVEALGTVTYDTKLVNTISARISGRIEKLYIKYRYQHVMKGERIMDIYSPDLLTTEQELLFLTKNDPSNISLISAAKQKLLLLGMNEGQLQQIIRSQRPLLYVAVYSNNTGHIHEAGSMPGQNNLERKMDISSATEELPIKEGMYVQKGETIFQVFNTDRSWVVLNIFPEYQALIKTGEAVKITPETMPGKSFPAKIDFIEPFYRKESKTMTARIYFDNTEMEIPIGSQVRSTIFVNPKEANWLPKDAVLSLGIDKVVFIKSMGGFRAHKIETGLSYNNKIQIISGLNSTDSVAENAQFLIDSESFIKVKDQQ
jgi:membrane fusion protein, copper/silver efflux system